MKEIEIIKPDDWHIHFRDNEIMESVVPETTKNFSRGIIMPNLIPPVLNGKQAVEYKERIKKSIPKNHDFEPFMTIYLTENTICSELKKAFDNKLIFAAKLYPAGATTNSDSGVKNVKNIISIFETMAKIGMPLLIHGETTDRDVDIFDREKEFINNTLEFIINEFPELKITLEHITTKDAVSYVIEKNLNLAASITPHHLALNRNSMLVGGIKPHYYCLPVLKREEHRKALVKAAISGNSKFFLGTDSAPHFATDKESSCGCAGVFNASYCLSILTQLFDNEKKLSALEAFTSINGAKHYGLKVNKTKIKLFKTRNSIIIPDELEIGNNKVIHFKPDFPVFWRPEKT